MVCVDDAEFQAMVAQEPGRGWLRAERRKGELYTVSGAKMELTAKRANGIGLVVDALMHVNRLSSMPEPPRSSSSWSARLLRWLWAGSADWAAARDRVRE
jgi:hypothetical protein